MILESVHIPTIYASVLGSGAKGPTEYALVLHVLQDMERNCIILTDDDGTILGAIRANVSAWPAKYRPLAQVLLKQLAKRQRFVKVPVSSSVASCAHRSCGKAFGLACSASCHPGIILVPDACDAGGNCSVVLHGAVAVGSYVTSNFASQRRAAEMLSIPPNTHKALFENQVLMPLFRHSKHVKLFDRQVGRSEMNTVIKPTSKNHFLRSIEWLFDQFVNSAVAAPGRTFDVTTGMIVSSRADLKSAKKAAEQLQTFAEGLVQKYAPNGPMMRIMVKQESRSSQLRHNRFLITDQVSVMFDRGFDLLSEKGLVRQVDISHTQQAPGDIEASFRTLPDLA